MKQAYREEHAKPLLEEYKAWLDKSIQQVPPKSAIGKAIAYSLNQWPKLIRHLEDGQFYIDNNRSERAIEPFVVGRKNWLILKYYKGCSR
jgi:transposase